MIIQPKIRSNICITAHPLGCAKEVERQINYVKNKGPFIGPKRVLVVGASTGYGLASRIVAAFGSAAATLGISYEKEGSPKGPGTAGWYNTLAFDHFAAKEGLVSHSINADAFSNDTKQQAAHWIKQNLGQIDLMVYSLASPARTDPKTGVLYRSALKPRGDDFTAKSVDPFTGVFAENTITAASIEEEEATVKVMGGEDWELWVEALEEHGLLAEGFMTVAYSYIGPEVTQAIYRNGTIGKAKEHLESTAHKLTERLEGVKGRALVSVNKALVTRASAVIPVVSLYVSVLYKVMKAKGNHETCIEQMDRLFRTKLYQGGPIPVDEQGLVRVDDWEMDASIQAEIRSIWDKLGSETVQQYADLEGFKLEFLQMHGFEVPGVDYNAEVNPETLNLD